MPPDRYQLDDKVVDGPGWSSWRARDLVLNRDVGVIVVDASHPRREAVAAAARAAACVIEPGFLHIYDVVEQPDGDLHLVREWSGGTRLVDRLADGPLPADEACALGIDVARTLSAAHASWVTHGALGPRDVLLTEDGRAIIAGLAVRAALDGPDPGAAPDGWSAAAVTYAAVTGRWPGTARDGLEAAEGEPPPRPRQVRAGVPRALDEALVEALAEPPDDPGHVAAILSAVLASIGRRSSDAPSTDSMVTTSRRDTTQPDDRRDPLAPSDATTETMRSPRARQLSALLIVAALATAGWFGFQLANADSVGGPGTPAGDGASTSPGPSSSPTDSPSGGASDPEDDAFGRVPVVAGVDFDPQGNGRENATQVPLAFDDNLATAWRTVTYKQPDLAPKPGVGVIFDLGKVDTVGAVRLNLVGAGTTLQVRVSETGGTRRGDFELFGKGSNVGEIVAFRSPVAVNARYVMVWLSGLPAEANGYRGGIAEITIARA